MQRALTPGQALEYPHLSAARERARWKRWNKGIVDMHLMILLLHKNERQCFFKTGMCGRDKEVALKLHFLCNHLYQSQDNQVDFYSHYRPPQTYQEQAANFPALSGSLIRGRFWAPLGGGVCVCLSVLQLLSWRGFKTDKGEEVFIWARKMLSSCTDVLYLQFHQKRKTFSHKRILTKKQRHDTVWEIHVLFTL